jgi:hypothetical protein
VSENFASFNCSRTTLGKKAFMLLDGGDVCFLKVMHIRLYYISATKITHIFIQTKYRGKIYFMRRFRGFSLIEDEFQTRRHGDTLNEEMTVGILNNCDSTLSFPLLRGGRGCYGNHAANREEGYRNCE